MIGHAQSDVSGNLSCFSGLRSAPASLPTFGACRTCRVTGMSGRR